MDTIKPIPFFKGWTLENFPFIEDDFDSITTYQFMCKIVEYLNKVIYNQKIIDTDHEEILKEIKDIRDYVDQYLTDVDDLKRQVNIIINDLETLTSVVETNTESINLLNEKIDIEIINLKNTLENLINENFNSLRTYIDYQDSILDEKINNIQIGAIQVYNPTNGLLEPLQVVINDLYEVTNKDGLTASEYDNLELTAQVFDIKQLTAYQFDSEGKILLT